MKKTRVLRHCLICKKGFEKNLCRLKIGKGKYCGRKCYAISKLGKPTWNKDKKGLQVSKFRGIPRPDFSGENHWNWRGGISETKRLDDVIWNNIRFSVYKRDNWTCQKCFKHCREDIQCHHRIPWRVSHDDSIENLITLCIPCHTKVEFEYRRKEHVYGVQAVLSNIS